MTWLTRWWKTRLVLCMFRRGDPEVRRQLEEYGQRKRK